ncbi:hypothetical protein ACVMIH_007400 [Bradyrhizobium sp. USDA 4503]
MSGGYQREHAVRGARSQRGDRMAAPVSRETKSRTRTSASASARWRSIPKLSVKTLSLHEQSTLDIDHFLRNQGSPGLQFPILREFIIEACVSRARNSVRHHDCFRVNSKLTASAELIDGTLYRSLLTSLRGFSCLAFGGLLGKLRPQNALTALQRSLDMPRTWVRAHRICSIIPICRKTSISILPPIGAIPETLILIGRDWHIWL